MYFTDLQLKETKEKKMHSQDYIFHAYGVFGIFFLLRSHHV